MADSNETTEMVTPVTARERMAQAKETLQSLTVDVSEITVKGKTVKIADIEGLTLGSYSRLKKRGITKSNLIAAAEDPDKAVEIVREALRDSNLRPEDLEPLKAPEAFAVVLHLAKQEQSAINWRSPDPT